MTEYEAMKKLTTYIKQKSITELEKQWEDFFAYYK